MSLTSSQGTPFVATANASTPTSDADAFEATFVIIPALNPSPTLLTLLAELRQQGFGKILLVDDGSADAFGAIFRAAEQAGASVIRHPVNLGKGEALKTAFRSAFALGAAAVVTVDADGQHSAADAARIARRVRQETSPVCVLGVRTFAAEVPLRSKFGNLLTRQVFQAFSSLRVSDTQTGLRGFSGDLLLQLCQVSGHRYEFEMQMLLWLARSKLPIVEVPIDTIYIDDNASSHFRPVVDSLKIYWVLFRDLFIALSSFGIDIALFSLCQALTGDILLSTYASRLISGAYNFIGNRIFVFKTIGNLRMRREMIQYILLALTLATASGGLVQVLQHATAWNVTLCKILIDLMLYGVSFLVRRLMIFKTDKKTA